MTGYTVPIVIPERACVDLLTTASGGCGYWINDYRPNFALDGERRVVRVHLARRAGGGESTEPAKVLTVTAKTIAQAIGELTSGRLAAGRVIGEVWESIDEDGGCGADLEAADCVLQVAIFGSVVYG